jgi:hypothetical protein
MKVDSGASANFHEVSHHLLHQLTSTSNASVSVIVPMTSQSAANLPLPNLAPSATISYGFPNLAFDSLLSVGKICDHNYTAIFANRSVKMFRNTGVQIKAVKPPLIAGTRNAPHQPLYNVHLPLPTPVHHSINLLAPESANAVNLPHIRDPIAFYHATMVSPVISTWTDAINAGFLDSFPQTHGQASPPVSTTFQSHHHHGPHACQRSNLRSTKLPKLVPKSPTYADVLALHYRPAFEDRLS